MNRTDRVLHNPDRSCATYTVPAIELQDAVALLILRIHVEAELATELEHAVLPATQPSAAHRDYSTIGSRPVPNSPAYAIACLDEHDRFPQSRSRRAAARPANPAPTTQ